MKYITGMTHQEILALTDEEIERMIKVKMAEEGIKILSPPEEPKYGVIQDADTSVFVSDITGFVGMHTFEGLEEILKIIMDVGYSKVEYDYSNEINRVEDFPSYANPFTISTKKIYSSELYSKVKSTVSDNNKLKKIYEKELKDYEDNLSSAEWIREEVHGAVDKARRIQCEKEEMIRRYKEYLELAGGDQLIAMRFLKKAYTVNQSTERYINENCKEDN